MKDFILTFVLCSVLFSCKSQDQNQQILLDTIPFDLKQGNILPDTLRFDVNGDSLNDMLLQFAYRNFGVDIPLGNSGQELAIYENQGDNTFKYKRINRKALWVIHTSIFNVDNKTFCIVNEEGGQDPNNYYFFIEYNERLDNWFLVKHQIKTYNTGEEILIEEKKYEIKEQIPFEKISFDEIFGEIHNDLPEQPWFKLIRVPRAIIYEKPEKATNMYLIEDDNVEIVEEQDEWLRFEYVNENEEVIRGWIKKQDVR